MGPPRHGTPHERVAAFEAADDFACAPMRVRAGLHGPKWGAGRESHEPSHYPYPFLDVPEHGYPVVLVNAALMAVLFLAISFGALALDRRLPGMRPPA